MTTRDAPDRAAKTPRLDAPDQQMMQISIWIRQIEHEDEPNTTYFEDEEVDNLELYDDQLGRTKSLDFDDTKSLGFEPDQADPTLEVMLSKLCKPFSIQDPNVSSDELSQLDALADKVEILNNLVNVLRILRNSRHLVAKEKRTFRILPQPKRNTTNIGNIYKSLSHQ